MTNSTFYCDGYNAGLLGAKKSPPDVQVYASEYLDGYRDGDYARVYRPSESEINTDSWCDDVNPGHLIP